MRRRSIVASLRPPIWQPEATTKLVDVSSIHGGTGKFRRTVPLSLPRVRFLEIGQDRFADLDRKIRARLEQARKELQHD